jgi:hypothetical protein
MTTARRDTGLLLVALGLAWLLAGSTANAAELRGKVTDRETGLPLGEATVRLVPPASGPADWPAAMVTGADGIFVWQGLAAAAHEIELAATG